MSNPRTHIDPEADKRHALKHAASAAKRLAAGELALNGAIVLAARTGASLREIAEATGLSHMTVKRTLERLDAGQDA